MRARPIKGEEHSAAPFDFRKFLCMKTVLQMPNGIEHILLRQLGNTVQLSSRGASLLHGTVAVTFEIEGLPRARFVKIALTKLMQMMEPERTMASGRWPYSALHLRDCLVALDGDLHGASYRQIAQTIYGPEMILDGWTAKTTSLKDRIRRAVVRGHDLMDGGYRNLLRKG
jgi:hypothetical protein